MVDNKIYGLLGISAKAGKVISGTDIVIENISREKLGIVIVAEDASEKTKKNIQFFCEKHNIDIIVFGKIFDNSKAIGKQNRAVIGIKDEKLAEVIKQKIKEKNLGGGVWFGKN